jgi:polyisoprenoid-binding protein YceI
MKIKICTLALLLLALTIINVKAQEVYTVKSVKAAVLGTSTLHDWESEITKIECTAHFKVENNNLKSIQNIHAKVLVKGIKSKEGKIMDNKTFEAFKYESNPYILFDAESAQVNMVSGQAAVKAVGNLTMAGETKQVTLEGNGKLLPTGDFQIEVSKILNMTEYKMVPPTAMLGAIKVGSVVTVKLSLVLTPTINSASSKQ